MPKNLSKATFLANVENMLKSDKLSFGVPEAVQQKAGSIFDKYDTVMADGNEGKDGAWNAQELNNANAGNAIGKILEYVQVAQTQGIEAANRAFEVDHTEETSEVDGVNNNAISTLRSWGDDKSVAKDSVKTVIAQTLSNAYNTEFDVNLDSMTATFEQNGEKKTIDISSLVDDELLAAAEQEQKDIDEINSGTKTIDQYINEQFSDVLSAFQGCTVAKDGRNITFTDANGQIKWKIKIPDEIKDDVIANFDPANLLAKQKQ